MKTLLKTSIIVLIMFTAYSCNKDKTINQTTISGKIVTDCAGTPMANQKLELYAQGNRALGKGGGTYQFTTDSEGNFSVKNENPIEGEEVRIQYSGGGMDLIILTGSGDENIGTLNINPTANYQLKIKINNTYSIGDTLIINDHKGIGAMIYKFPAPLSDTVLSLVSNYSNSLQAGDLKYMNKVLVESSPSIHSGAPGTSSFTVRLKEYFNFYLDGCNNTIQEVIVTIN